MNDVSVQIAGLAALKGCPDGQRWRSDKENNVPLLQNQKKMLVVLSLIPMESFNKMTKCPGAKYS
jgi:hypothetical protein